MPRVLKNAPLCLRLRVLTGRFCGTCAQVLGISLGRVGQEGRRASEPRDKALSRANERLRLYLQQVGQVEVRTFSNMFPRVCIVPIQTGCTRTVFCCTPFGLGVHCVILSVANQTETTRIHADVCMP